MRTSAETRRQAETTAGERARLAMAYGGQELPKAARVYAALRDAIIAMRLRPGARLVEKDICAELGVSRTPFRDAVMRLAGQRLVTVVPSDATFVNKIILEEVVEGQIVRESLELRFAAIAAARFVPAFEKDFELLLWRQAEAARRCDGDESFHIDREFHRLLCRCAGFPHIWDTIHEANGQLDRVLYRAFPLEDYYGQVLDEHRAIFEALRKRDAEGVTRIMGPHLRDNLHSFRVLMNREPDLVEFDPSSSACEIMAQIR
ncbi:GntR family transcriptional regulator [Aureimonas populi]|uniref:GntR family transcriptional regulator n=1 Tax=Aureimonas populi TaxID=1701758 RepID=A0ABW5CLY4_9HYPH|nr:GntR family transcriptional regulator [Aureimonas populi]